MADTLIGTYAMNVTADGHGFHVERKLVIKPLKVEPAGYEAVRAFFAEVARGDNTLLMFRRSP